MVNLLATFLLLSNGNADQSVCGGWRGRGGADLTVSRLGMRAWTTAGRSTPSRRRWRRCRRPRISAPPSSRPRRTVDSPPTLCPDRPTQAHALPISEREQGGHVTVALRVFQASSSWTSMSGATTSARAAGSSAGWRSSSSTASYRGPLSAHCPRARTALTAQQPLSDYVG